MKLDKTKPPSDKAKLSDAKPPPDKAKLSDTKPPPDKAKLSDTKPPPDKLKPPPDVSKPPADQPSTTDLALPQPCSAGSTLSYINGSNDVAVCQAASSISHCSSTSLCNASDGWTLCTASQFKARYPSLISPLPAPMTFAWLQSCMRDGAAPFGPSDSLCSSCTQNLIGAADTAWLCGGTSPYSNAAWGYIGVSTAVLCYTLGVNNASNSGYWGWAPVDTTSISRALCCK